ncbi:MAG: lipopolysaccharide heptosyltransferase [Pseudomonadota bacterium]|jgi:heptosyltransferase-1
MHCFRLNDTYNCRLNIKAADRLKILLVKLSSLGDVLHTLPVVNDIKTALPDAQIDWVVEAAFAGVVRRCEGVNKVITCELRKWRKALLSPETRQAWGAFTADLQRETYDAVIDLQGLTKSAVVSKLAKLSSTGKRYAMANRTDGSSYEAPTRWLADEAIQLAPHVHAVQRARLVCAQALRYKLTENAIFTPKYRLLAGVNIASTAINSIAKFDEKKTVVFAHGSSREDKLWPVSHWVALGHRLNAAGFGVALAHGSAAEEQRSQDIASQLNQDKGTAEVWPRLGIDVLVDAIAGTAGVVGVDSGLSHMAVALDLPHVQIYNFDTAWRTGPIGSGDLKVGARQVSVFAQPAPSVDAVWQAWLAANSVSSQP